MNTSSESTTEKLIFFNARSQESFEHLKQLAEKSNIPTTYLKQAQIGEINTHFASNQFKYLILYLDGLQDSELLQIRSASADTKTELIAIQSESEQIKEHFSGITYVSDENFIKLFNKDTISFSQLKMKFTILIQKRIKREKSEQIAPQQVVFLGGLINFLQKKFDAVEDCLEEFHRFIREDMNKENGIVFIDEMLSSNAVNIDDLAVVEEVKQAVFSKKRIEYSSGKLFISYKQISFVFYEEIKERLFIDQISHFVKVAWDKLSETILRLKDKEREELQIIFSNVHEGILKIDNNGVIDNQYSQVCHQFFGDRVGGENIFHLLKQNNVGEKTVNLMKEAVELYIDGSSDFDMIKGLLPSELTLKKNEEINLSLNFVTIESSILFDERKLMIVFKNVTEETRLADKEEIEKEKINFLIKAIENIEGFEDFQADNEKLLNSISKILKDFSEEHVKALYLLLHTLKGSLRHYELSSSSDIVHDMESDIYDFQKEQIPFQEMEAFLQNKFMKLNEMYRSQLDFLKNIIDLEELRDEKSIKFDKEEFENFEKIILERASSKDKAIIQAHFEELMKKPISNFFKQYESIIKQTATQLDKSVKTSFEGEEIKIDFEKFGDFFKSIEHVIRNAVDHGMETEAERLFAEKEPLARLSIRLERKKKDLQLTIEDDGKGIEIQAIADRAKQKEILKAEEIADLTEEEILKLIFHPGFSTKDVVSELSGRGVGLSAVKAELEKIGGFFQIETELSKGTKFIFSIPN